VGFRDGVENGRRQRRTVFAFGALAGDDFLEFNLCARGQHDIACGARDFGADAVTGNKRYAMHFGLSNGIEA
jgi:hypothetical protein